MVPWLRLQGVEPHVVVAQQRGRAEHAPAAARVPAARAAHRVRPRDVRPDLAFSQVVALAVVALVLLSAVAVHPAHVALEHGARGAHAQADLARQLRGAFILFLVHIEVMLAQQVSVLEHVAAVVAGDVLSVVRQQMSLETRLVLEHARTDITAHWHLYCASANFLVVRSYMRPVPASLVKHSQTHRTL